MIVDVRPSGRCGYLVLYDPENVAILLLFEGLNGLHTHLPAMTTVKRLSDEFDEANPDVIVHLTKVASPRFRNRLMLTLAQ